MIEIEGILKYLGEQEKENKKDEIVKKEQKIIKTFFLPFFDTRATTQV